MQAAAAVTMATPAPSSTAPWPRSQLSRWALMSTVSWARSVPGTSPITLCVVASTSLFASSFNSSRSGRPCACQAAIASASGTETAKAGMRGTPIS
jgi:hypothetical protein